MYFSSDCFLESVGNCQLRSLQEVDFSAPKSKVSPHFGVSVPYFHGGYSEGHFEVWAMSGRGSTKSEQYQPTINEKPSETMFQRVLFDFVLKTFGLGAENEPRARIRGHFSRTIFTPPAPGRGAWGRFGRVIVSNEKSSPFGLLFFV